MGLYTISKNVAAQFVRLKEKPSEEQKEDPRGLCKVRARIGAESRNDEAVCERDCPSAHRFDNRYLAPPLLAIGHRKGRVADG